MSKRSDKMKKHSPKSLAAIVASGSLSAAAAQYEINKRAKA